MGWRVEWWFWGPMQGRTPHAACVTALAAEDPAPWAASRALGGGAQAGGQLLFSAWGSLTVGLQSWAEVSPEHELKCLGYMVDFFGSEPHQAWPILLRVVGGLCVASDLTVVFVSVKADAVQTWRNFIRAALKMGFRDLSTCLGLCLWSAGWRAGSPVLGRGPRLPGLDA